jgi:hypothetical protein
MVGRRRSPCRGGFTVGEFQTAAKWRGPCACVGVRRRERRRHRTAHAPRRSVPAHSRRSSARLSRRFADDSHVRVPPAPASPPSPRAAHGSRPAAHGRLRVGAAPHPEAPPLRAAGDAPARVELARARSWRPPSARSPAVPRRSARCRRCVEVFRSEARGRAQSYRAPDAGRFHAMRSAWTTSASCREPAS